MKSTKSTLNSVLTKLNAMRVTLSDEEQAILDRIVLTASPEDDEVKAHAIMPKATPGKQSVGKAIPAVEPEDDEVKAHAMTPKATPSKQSVGKAIPAVEPEDDEVKAHAMTPRASVSKATPIKIIFDAEKGKYIAS